MTSLFLSYARSDDEPFVRRLHGDLTARGFEVWWDRVSMPSRALTFLQEIRDAISARDRLVLVVGPDALASEYVEAEWRWAFDFGKPVNPILRLGEYDILPDELKLLDAPDFRDDAHYDERLETLVRQLSEPVPPMGKLVGVPSLPPHLLKRADRLRALKDAVLADVRRTAVVTGEPARVGVHGMGGIGKSVLATMLARDTEVRRAFPNGVIWVPIGQTPNLAELQRAVAKALGDPGIFDNTGEGRAKLQELLADRAVLLLLDDLWDAGHADAFDCLGPRCRMVITSRDAGIITALGGTEHQVQLLTEAEARDLLAEWAGLEVAALPEQAAAVMAHCGRLPLALSLCGAMVRDGASWDDLVEALVEADLEYLDHPHGSILRSIKVSVDRLEPDEAARFAELRVFLSDATTPEAAVATLWAHTGGLSERHARKLLTEMETKALIRLDGVSPNRQVSLHDLVYDYAGGMIADEAALHGHLLEAYRKRCPDGWASGPNDAYYFEHLREHLMAAGQAEETAALCLDLRWLEVKAEVGLVFDLPADFTAAQEALPLDDPWRRNLRLLEQALRNDLHFIARHPTTVFQCFWNSAWWYDCPEAAQHYDPPEGGWNEARPPWERPEPKLCSLLERWRKEKEARQAGFQWIRSLRPPPQALGSSQIMCLHGHEGSVWCVVFSPDGHCLASGSDDNTVRVWNIESGVEVACLRGHENWVMGVTFSPDGERLASGSWDQTVRVWDLASQKQVGCLRGHDDGVRSVVFSPDGQLLATGSDDHTVRVWDLHALVESACLRGHDGLVASVIFHPDASRLMSGSQDGTVRVWDTSASAEVTHLRRTLPQTSVIALSPDGAFVVSGGQNQPFEPQEPIHVWDANAGTEVATLRGHEDRVTSVAFAPGGLLASGSNDMTVRLWDLRNGRQTRCFRGHTDYVNAVAFSSDEQRIASASGGYYDRTHPDRAVHVWDVEHSEEVGVLRDHRSSIEAVAISYDDRHIATGSHDHTVRLWEVRDGVQVFCLSGHSAAVMAVAFAPDDRYVAAGARDGAVRIWCASSGEPVACLLGHTRSVINLFFAADGQIITSAYTDEPHVYEVRTWDILLGKCIDVEKQEGAICIRSDRLLPRPHEKVYRLRQSPSGEWVEEVDGDDGAIRSSLAAEQEDQITVVKSLGTGAPSAFLKLPLQNVVSSWSAPVWAGSVHSHLALITLEGGPEAPEEALT